MLCLALVLAIFVPARPATGADQAPVWDALVKQFVNAQHRVDYAGLKREASPRLDAYVTALAGVDLNSLAADDKKAVLLNAYNAFTVEWIVRNYPVPSIWSTPEPFTEPRHDLGGRMLSLDQIESQLRGMRDPRVHAALVCAARSCPPLRREAYDGSRVDAQLDANVREWLANPALNRFDAATGAADISPIFEWYSQDFEAYPGGLQAFLTKYAPPEVVKAMGARRFDIRFEDYNWGLNDQGNAGADYSGFRFDFDRLRNWLRSL